MDHVDRAMSAVDKGWSSQIELEALGKVWGMKMLMLYLIGKHFTAWGDHRPLTSIFNNTYTPTFIWIDHLCKKVQDLDFTNKFIPGKNNTCDYQSSGPTSIEDLPRGSMTCWGSTTTTTS